jgi:hypothetical protein
MCSTPRAGSTMPPTWLRMPSLFLFLAIALLAKSALYGQMINQVTGDVNSGKLVPLANHHPQWAIQSNRTGLLSADLPLNLTLVLSRSPQQEQALKQLLADQQNLASPDYHHWLSPTQMGERFGLSENDITAITGWLRSQGLDVNWVSPSRVFIGFGGSALAIGRAFHTELQTYKAAGIHGGVERMSVSSDPMIPLALVPAIKSINGLYTVEDQPLHLARAIRSDSPELTTPSGIHIIAPVDFRTIYDYSGVDTSSQAIGIVGRSRTDFADFENFRQKTGTNFPNPTEIVPTSFGAVDPGPALTAPPAATVSTEDQLEATLDVTLAGSVSNGARLLLVVATAASGGIEADAQYLVQSSPVPAPIMTVSFGECESSAGPSGVSFWETLFQQAAAEGISVLVSSGDSGASGCDQNFAAPPAAPLPNSPNYICSSGYATCVGGTQFDDAANSSQYWSANNGPSLGSALGYIPEGGWNEPLDSSGTVQVAASGGGVSSVIATPSWQNGTGVPTTRSGRYTPDIAFSASAHDGYFGCFAAGSGNCVDAADGAYSFEYFFGTSVAAPAMAALTAALDTTVGAPQGNLAPQLYQMAATAPTVFHDVTVTSSGVATCEVDTPSLCNNSIPGPLTLSGGQSGYLVTAGFDEVTGLGSLDVGNLLNNFPTPPTIKILSSPPSVTFPQQLVGFPAQGAVQIENSGSMPLDPLTIAITGANAGDFATVNGCQSALDPQVQCQLQVIFTPSAAGARMATLTVTSANGSNSPLTVPLSGTGTSMLYEPYVSLNESSTTITTAQALTITVLLVPPTGVPKSPAGIPIAPTGTVTITSAGYTSMPATISGNTATFVIPAGTLPVGTEVIFANYSPNSASAAIYTTASGSYPITVTAVPPPGFIIEANNISLTPGATSLNTESVMLVPSGGFTGSVVLTAAITAGPASPNHPPTFNFGTTSPVNVTGSTASGTLTIYTTAPSSANLASPLSRISWYTTGGGSLACLLLMGIPARRRHWRKAIGLVGLLILLAGGVSACGGSSGNKSGTTTGEIIDPGTSAGNYTVTITGTSGKTTAAASIILTVQ